MKKCKKTICFLLAGLFAFALTACVPTEPVAEPPEEPTEQPTEPTVYDDKGAYDAIVDKVPYEWDDGEGVLDGAFSDGATVKPYATFSQAYVDGGNIAEVNAASGAEPLGIRYLTGEELIYDAYVDTNIRAGSKGSHDDDTTLTGLEEKTYIEVQSEGKKTVYLSMKPDCTLEAFEEADYISFAMCMDNASTGSNSSNTVAVSFKGIGLMTLYRCTWYEIKVPLDCWRNTNDKSVYDTKEALYNSLTGAESETDESEGVFFKLVSSAADGTDAADYTVYISDMSLGVEEIDEGLGRELTVLTETASFHEKELLTNTHIYWGTTEKVRRLDEGGVNKNMVKYIFSNYDGGNFAVVPKKKLAQIVKYDYICVTMYIETENPSPIEVGINGKWDVKPKSASRIYKTLNTQNQIYVSANKWITYKIPIEDIMPVYYAGLTLNRLYTATGVSYDYEYNSLPLFYINGDFATRNDPEDKTYGFNLYVSRIFLTKNDV